MPSFYPENNTPQLSDDQRRSLHKINALLDTGSGTAGTPSAAVTSVQGIAAGVPVGVKPTSFRATANFTRPGDTTAYAQFDAITDSTSPQAYAQIQPAVDAAFYDEKIATGNCDHILPVELPVQSDGLCYIALAELMTSHPDAAGFIASVEEVTEAQYQVATAQEEPI